MPLTVPADALGAALDAAFGQDVPQRLGVAVSGGGDSMALLDLLRRWGKAEILVASVNHGLRSEAGDEIALVADYAARYDIPHSILNWQWSGQGNLQQAAREGRRVLLRDWAERSGLRHIALGHTADDQAETFLMRLARGSGVDGLSAMMPLRQEGGLIWMRPLLSVGREALRAHLQAAGIDWADDPSNEDARFDRVKIRQMMAHLSPLGLSVSRLGQTAQHMQAQRDLAKWAADRAAQDVLCYDAGDVVFDVAGFESLPDALRARLFADALVYVSSKPYRPRFSALSAALSADRAQPLHGCLVIPKAGQLRITREWKAVKDLRAPIDGIWDARWRVCACAAQMQHDLEIAALGEAGLAAVPQWRESGRPRQSLIASPAVWRGDTLIAAPLAGLTNGWDVQVLTV